MFVLDSHCDTPSQIHRLRNVGIRNSRGQVDFPKMLEGGVDGAFFAMYVPASLAPDEATAYAVKLIGETCDAVAACPDLAEVVTSREEAFKARSEGRVSVFLAIENGSAIQDSLSLLRFFYSCGIRYMTLSHSRHNAICDSCTPESPRWNGLSLFGREVVREMNRLGMLVDVSHISDASFYDVLKYSDSPVVATHSCCRALADHPRNMSDDMIRALAAAGGVIQINFYPVFLDDAFSRVLAASGLEERGDAVESEFIKDPADPVKRAAWYEVEDALAALERPSFRRICDHIDHAVSLVGTDHVGLGSDFDGISVTPEGMEDVSHFSAVLDELRLRGYTESDIEKIAGGNLLRILR